MGTKLKVKDLSLTDIDFLIAKLEGVDVMRFENPRFESAHCAIEEEFDPESHVNHYCLKQFKQWTWYEPTRNWSIGGPIIQKELISISQALDDDGNPNAWSYFIDENGDENLEYAGDTPLEAAMRSIIAKHFGEDIDMENLPTIKRMAKVKVSVFCEAIVDDQYGDIELEVEAETGTEAESLAMEEVQKAQPDYEILDVYFLGWK